MNVMQAMRETVALMEERFETLASDYDPDDEQRFMLLDESLKPPHVRDMLRAMESRKNPQGGEFSDGKMNRWLAWAQAAVVAQGLASLEDMKVINKRNSGKNVDGQDRQGRN